MSAASPLPGRRDLVMSLIGLVIVVATGIFYRAVVGTSTTSLGAGPLFALGFLSIVGVVAGQFATIVGLPRLTGYLIAGIIVGPQLAGFITRSDVDSLGLVNARALALIALQAGAEVTLPILERIWKSLTWAAIANVVFMVGGCGVVFYLLAGQVPSLAGVPTGAVIAVSVLWGVFSFTRSPSVTLAILADTRAKGPMSEWALGLVVVLDVLVLPIFTGSLTFARSQLEGMPFEPAVFLELSHELWDSVLAGIAGGLVLGFILRLVKTNRVLIVVVVGSLVTASCAYLRLDTLFVFVVIGFVAVNVVGVGEVLLHATERTSGAVFVVFFALAGAKLDLEALKTLWPVALALTVARIVLTIIASHVGHALAKDVPVVRRWGWMALVSQAGVTIGLAMLVGDVLPGVGKPLATLVIAVIGINQLIGPILFKFALGRSGEIPDGNAPTPTPTTTPEPATKATTTTTTTTTAATTAKVSPATTAPATAPTTTSTTTEPTTEPTTTALTTTTTVKKAGP